MLDFWDLYVLCCLLRATVAITERWCKSCCKYSRTPSRTRILNTPCCQQVAETSWIMSAFHAQTLTIWFLSCLYFCPSRVVQFYCSYDDCFVDGGEYYGFNATYVTRNCSHIQYCDVDNTPCTDSPMNCSTQLGNGYCHKVRSLFYY